MPGTDINQQNVNEIHFQYVSLTVATQERGSVRVSVTVRCMLSFIWPVWSSTGNYRQFMSIKVQSKTGELLVWAMYAHLSLVCTVWLVTTTLAVPLRRKSSHGSITNIIVIQL